MSSKILLKSLIVNLFLTIVKFIGSVLGNSKHLYQMLYILLVICQLIL